MITQCKHDSDVVMQAYARHQFLHSSFEQKPVFECVEQGAIRDRTSENHQLLI